MALITIAEYEIYTQTVIDDGNPSVSGSEAFYTFIIDSISDQIERITNRKFNDATYTEKYDGNGQDFLMLNQYPVISLTSVNYVNPLDDATTELSVDDITINNETGELYYPFRFAKGRYNVSVVYTAGYTSVPDALKLTVCEMVYDAASTSSKLSGLTREKLGDYEYEISVGTVVSAEHIGKLSTFIKYD